VFHGLAVDYVAYRQFDDFATDRPRDVGDLDDLAGHMPRRRVIADLPPDSVDQLLVKCRVRPELDEQYDPLIALPLLADDDALQCFGDLLDLAIDFGGADPHAPRVQRGVGPAVKDQCASIGQLDVIAVPPDAGKMLEIGRAVLLAAWIIPEADGH